MEEMNKEIIICGFSASVRIHHNLETETLQTNSWSTISMGFIYGK